MVHQIRWPSAHSWFTRPSAWVVFLTMGIAACGLYLYPVGKAYYDILGLIFSLVTLTALISGVRWYRPAFPWPWYSLMVCYGALVFANVVWLYYDGLLGSAVPFPSVADIGYLAQYPSVGAALLLMFHRRAGARIWSVLLDSMMLTTGAGLCLWVGLMDRYWDDAQLPLLSKLIAMAYPGGDLLIFALALCFLLLPGRRSIPYFLLLFSLGATFITDLFYSGLTLSGQYQTGDPLGAGWLLAYVFVGTVALHPDMRELAAAQTSSTTSFSRRHVAIVLAAGLVGPLLYALRNPLGLHVDTSVIIFGSVMLFVLAVTRMAQLTHQVRQNEVSFRQLFAANPHAMWVYDVDDLRIVEVNDAAVAQYGYPRETFIGLYLSDLRPFADRPRFNSRDFSALPQYQSRQSTQHMRRDGSVFAVEIDSHALSFRGRATRIVVARDVTAREALERELEHQAFHDALTGLPNRALLMDRLRQSHERTKRDGRPLAVIFLDLDRFKDVNDGYGHEAGDTLLVDVAHRLQRVIRGADTLARFGGDEFTLVLGSLHSPAEAEIVATRILEILQVPFLIAGQERMVTASIGIILSTQGQDDPADLLRFADTALYRAKASGRNQYAVFDTSMSDLAIARAAREADLRHAIEDGDLLIAYQPKVALTSGKPLGLEALVRWPHPEHGLIPPGDFIPLAEETGLILSLGEWVLRTACRQFSQWRTEFPATQSLLLSVNLSARQLMDPGLATLVSSVLLETQLPPECLQLEITESLLMDNTARTIETLARLREIGVQVAIDDFGTGYSSLSYLSRFPVNAVKIDKGFVQALASHADNAAIIEAVVGLARTLSLEVVAEGIETAEDRERLATLGCDIGQGFLFAHPLDASCVPGWVYEHMNEKPDPAAASVLRDALEARSS